MTKLETLKKRHNALTRKIDKLGKAYGRRLDKVHSDFARATGGLHEQRGALHAKIYKIANAPHEAAVKRVMAAIPKEDRKYITTVYSGIGTHDGFWR